MMVMGKHDAIAPGVGDRPFATLKRRPDEPLDHLDQRGGADNRVELIKHHGLEGRKVLRKEPIGDIEPLGSCAVMGTFVLGLALMTQMIMVPSDEERVSDVLRHPLQELGIQHCGVLIRPNAIVKVSANGCVPPFTHPVTQPVEGLSL
jgi:hypothetical protein